MVITRQTTVHFEGERGERRDRERIVGVQVEGLVLLTDNRNGISFTNCKFNI